MRVKGAVKSGFVTVVHYIFYSCVCMYLPFNVRNFLPNSMLLFAFAEECHYYERCGNLLSIGISRWSKNILVATLHAEAQK